jgi:hypothetical protein
LKPTKAIQHSHDITHDIISRIPIFRGRKFLYVLRVMPATADVRATGRKHGAKNMSERIADGERPDETVIDGAFTLERFCNQCGIGRTAAYQEIRKGRLEARKRGKATLISRDAARRWFVALPRLRPPTTQAAA